MGSGNPVKEGQERMCEPEGTEDTEKSKPSEYSKTLTGTSSQTLGLHAQGLHGSVTDGVLGRKKLTFLTQKLFPTDNNL